MSDSITLVTHAALPGGAPDDLLLATALAREGLATRFAVWSDTAVDWATSPLTVVRSAWDYHRAPQAWRPWLARAGALTRLLNPPALLAWNTDKRYLRTLQAAGVPCVPTQFIEPGGAASGLRLWWADCIVKPAVAASAFGVRRFRGDGALAEAQAHARELADYGAVLIQPYLPAVETAGERSLVFIDGRFSHAFTKPAFSANAVGRTAVQPHLPSPADLAVAMHALAAAPQATLYARVDLVPHDGGMLLMELELIEPDLALRLHESAAPALAQACARALGS
ncbi:ATP-grasp domain-containing protein [Roseateles sp. LYH14W]|uniref:RimK family alpha-L-glutamate ligase n=1 Tax=Pelomonas parva TaxID=3299032 RepID=A0ABW7F6I9_9BURK